MSALSRFVPVPWPEIIGHDRPPEEQARGLVGKGQGNARGRPSFGRDSGGCVESHHVN
jgi:hypothetical protein